MWILPNANLTKKLSLANLPIAFIENKMGIQPKGEDP